MKLPDLSVKKVVRATAAVTLLAVGLFALYNLAVLLAVAGSLFGAVKQLRQQLRLDPLLTRALGLAALVVVLWLIKHVTSRPARNWRPAAAAIIIGCPLLAWLVLRIRGREIDYYRIRPGSVDVIRRNSDQESVPPGYRRVTSDDEEREVKKYAQRQIQEVSDPLKHGFYNQVTGEVDLWIDPATCKYYNKSTFSPHTGRPTLPAAQFFEQCQEKKMLAAQRSQIETLQETAMRLRAKIKLLDSEAKELRAENEALRSGGQATEQASMDLANPELGRQEHSPSAYTNRGQEPHSSEPQVRAAARTNDVVCKSRRGKWIYFAPLRSCVCFPTPPGASGRQTQNDFTQGATGR